MNILGRDLSPGELDNLDYLLRSPAYATVFEPMMRGIERGYQEDLIAEPSTRIEKSDAYLRAGILLIRSLLDLPAQLVAERREQVDAEQEQKSEEQDYADRASTGGGPVWEDRGPWDKDFPPEEDY